jgi:hypothetical protein
MAHVGLGHSHPSLPAPAQPDVRYAPNCDQRIAAPQFDAMGHQRTLALQNVEKESSFVIWLG